MSTAIAIAATPPADPVAHRRRRLRRLGLTGALAATVAELAYGPLHDSSAVMATFGAGVGDVAQAVAEIDGAGAS